MPLRTLLALEDFDSRDPSMRPRTKRGEAGGRRQVIRFVNARVEINIKWTVLLHISAGYV
jgi:hypothetical protein